MSIEEIYFKIRKDEINKGKRNLKKLKVNTVYLCITRNCWKYNIQYQVIVKNKDKVILNFKSGEKNTLLQYHKATMVFYREYCKFLNTMDINKIEKGFYITTGIFEEKVLKENKKNLFRKKIKLEDGRHFLKEQLGYGFTINDVFKKKKLNFYKYLV